MKVTSQGGGDYENPPSGLHVARCIRVVDLGTQKSDYQGKTTYPRKLMVTWELPTEFMKTEGKENQPFTVSNFYTASIGVKANLRKVLESWRGKPFTVEEENGFDMKNVIGKPCMLNIILNDKEKAKIMSVTTMPKGMECPKQINPSVFFSLEPEEYDAVVLEKLSDWTKGEILKSPEYAELKNQVQRQPGEDDEEPAF